MSESLQRTQPLLPEKGTNAVRRAAGEDPKKRDQILEGAKRVFMAAGFDAASMNDITREAGVSKGTIYVYFDNKEDLFLSLMERERLRMFASMREVLATSAPVEEVLYRYGIGFATHITRRETVRAMRTMIGVVDRLPDLSARVFNGAQDNPRTFLADWLTARTAEGLLQVEDADLAARQFIDLATSGFFKYAVLGDPRNVASQAEVERVVSAAVTLFLRSYATGCTRPA